MWDGYRSSAMSMVWLASIGGGSNALNGAMTESRMHDSPIRSI
jgi:hypothetical protein